MINSNARPDDRLDDRQANDHLLIHYGFDMMTDGDPSETNVVEAVTDLINSDGHITAATIDEVCDRAGVFKIDTALTAESKWELVEYLRDELDVADYGPLRDGLVVVLNMINSTEV